MPRPMTVTITVAMLALFAPCGPAPFPPAGSYSDVAVIVEGGEGGEWAGLLRAGLGAEEDYFVAREPRFSVSVFGTEAVDGTPAVKNVVVCGVMDPATEIGRRIAATIGRRDAERVRRGELTLIEREDHPALGQLTLVVTAGSVGALRAFLRDRVGDVTEALEASCRRRLRRNLLGGRRDFATRARQERWGFHLEVPSVYETVGAGADNGVELQRDGPARVLGVFWRDWPAPPAIESADDLFRARAEYVYRRYDGDRMDRARVRFDVAGLGENAAVRMCGYWYNDRYAPAGGFYETYFIWRHGRLWAVDLLVFAPGREKGPLLRELRALAETFRPPA